jgi:branched-chain amino acid transport system permease protein
MTILVKGLPLQISVQYLLAQFMNGLALGMVLVLIALGLSLIFGTMGIINFAHGDMLLVGAYVAWWVTTETGSHVAGFIAAPVAVLGVGLVMEMVGLRRIYDENPLLQLLLTFGVAEILREGVQVIWGRTGKTFPTPEWASGSVTLGFFSYPSYRLFVILATTVIIIALYWFLTRTDTGIIIRAGTADREMVNALGINIFWLFSVIFGIGAALAGLAGALIGPIRNVSPLLGVNLLIPAFVVVIVGGVGSFIGTVISGLLIGLIVVLTGVVAPNISNIVIYAFMALILLLRPYGLFGESGVLE